MAKRSTFLIRSVKRLVCGECPGPKRCPRRKLVGQLVHELRGDSKRLRNVAGIQTRQWEEQRTALRELAVEFLGREGASSFLAKDGKHGYIIGLRERLKELKASMRRKYADTRRLNWMLGGSGTLRELETGAWDAYSGPLDRHFERKSGRGAIDAVLTAERKSKRGGR